MVVKKVTIAVDRKFFNKVFEAKRKETQNKLGVINLSQVNFTKMIDVIKIKPLKLNLLDVKSKRKGRNGNVKI